MNHNQRGELSPVADMVLRAIKRIESEGLAPTDGRVLMHCRSLSLPGLVRGVSELVNAELIEEEIPPRTLRSR